MKTVTKFETKYELDGLDFEYMYLPSILEIVPIRVGNTQVGKELDATPSVPRTAQIFYPFRRSFVRIQ